MPTLILNFPEGEMTTIAVDREIVKLGRARYNDIMIPERHMSSAHAEFRRRPDGGYELVDLGSLNGTFVNGLRLTERHGLHEGDRIVFGLLECKFLHARPEEANGDDQQLTRGVAIDLIHAAAAIRENPQLAQAAIDLQKQVAQATGQGAQGPKPLVPPGTPPRPQPGERLPSATPAPVPSPVPAPPRRPTIQMVTPSRTGRNRQVILEVQTPVPSSSLTSERPPESFLPSQARSPFSVAPPDGFPPNGNGTVSGNGSGTSNGTGPGLAPPGGLNGQIPVLPPKPPRRLPWHSMFDPHRPGTDDHG